VAEPPTDARPASAEETIARITAAQRPLYAYVRSLVAPWGSVEDVLQEVNLVLWRKAAEFDGRGEFLSWACRIAFLQVLAHRKKLRSSRFVPLDEAILADLSGLATEHVREADARLDALRRCLESLPDDMRRLIASRYRDGGSVEAAAKDAGRPAGSVRVSLHRIRKSLLECIQNRLAGEPR
jgi:RNA polymerase sigma-70 factor (ECF subfamily)